MNRLTPFRGFLVVVSLAAFLYSQLPLGTALLFGDDEGCELMKALMCGHGYHLYTDIWNDQPPLFTLLLSLVFKYFGARLVVGRLVATAFGVLLLGAFYWLVQQRLGPWKAILAAFFLIASPDVLEVSASVMLEVPTFAMALLSACLLFRWVRRRQSAWLLASGAVIGLAFQFKFTAAMIVPAMLAEIFLASRADVNARLWTKTAVANLARWGASAAFVFWGILAVFARGSLAISWRSHFEEHSGIVANSAADYPFQTSLLWNHIECVVAALVGIILIVRSRRWREFAFPVVWLLTDIAIHSVHRPWWSYYYLHFAVPLSWLAALAVGEAIQTAARRLSRDHSGFFGKDIRLGVALCILAAVVLVRSEKRLEMTIKDMRLAPSASGDPIVRKMKQYANRTHWVYAEQEIYPFDAGLKVPPELTVVVLKRLWSRQISEQQIVELCERYSTEQILLNLSNIGTEWNDFLRSNYAVACQTTNTVLFVAKRIE